MRMFNFYLNVKQHGLSLLLPVLFIASFSSRAIASSSTDTGELQQAINYDLSGEPLKARKLYDLLRSSPFEKAAAIPSAVNHFALGDYKKSLEEFRLINSAEGSRDAGYIYLWRSLLSAKMNKGNIDNDMYKSLSSYHFTYQPEKYIAEFFLGKLSFDNFLIEIDKLHVESLQIKKDIKTEALFFSSCWLAIVKNDEVKARQIIQSNKENYLFQSLETPLLKSEGCMRK